MFRNFQAKLFAKLARLRNFVIFFLGCDFCYFPTEVLRWQVYVFFFCHQPFRFVSTRLEKKLAKICHWQRVAINAPYGES